ncbi:MAG: hypothetical protein EWV60_21205 [Microcystis sp. Msp_OC_L_20101000_S702]|nr:MAG: hypothetical protein EWV60_21205 [Microcystis sp. Msp_OC_L_20101000_S702]
MPPLLRGIPPPIVTPLIKGGRGDRHPLIKGDPPAYRHPPYQGGQGGSNLKSIFNLIITSYLSAFSPLPNPKRSNPLLIFGFLLAIIDRRI